MADELVGRTAFVDTDRPPGLEAGTAGRFGLEVTHVLGGQFDRPRSVGVSRMGISEVSR